MLLRCGAWGWSIPRRGCSTKSALFVSGRQARSRFAVFTPKTDFDRIRNNRELLGRVYELRKSSFRINALLEELDNYTNQKAELEALRAAYDRILATVKEERKGGGELNLPLVQRMQSKKKKINTMKETLWDIEESLLPALLRVQNCDAKSVLDDRLHYSHQRGLQLKDSQELQSHASLCARHGLATFSPASHTAVYLHHELARLEQVLVRHCSAKLRAAGFEQFSNPDFTKSVMLEGCGLDPFHPDSAFTLNPHQEFGDRESCNAMYLTGGASFVSFASYFARSVLQNSSILPLRMFSCGRSYTPRPAPATTATPSLFALQQSQAVAGFCLAVDEAGLEVELDCLLSTMQQLLAGWPNLTVTELSLASCHASSSRQFSFSIKGAQAPVEVGSVSVQGRYLSDRMMMAHSPRVVAPPGQPAVPLAPYYTASMQLDMTRLLGLAVELCQDPTEPDTLNLDLVHTWLQ